MTKALRPPVSMQLTTVDFLCTARPTLHTDNLDASVLEYVDAFGFRLVQHIPHTAALLTYGAVRVQLVQRYKQYETPTNCAPAVRAPRTCRMAVECIFDLYHALAQRVRHQLSGMPTLNMLGCWEFSMQDNQGNTLCFAQTVVRDVFSSTHSPRLSM